MAQIHWLNAINGAFDTAADWTGSAIPGPADDAILDAAGATKYTVTATGKESVNSIQTAATATLQIKTSSGAGGFSVAAGSGAGVDAGRITVADGGDLILGGTLHNTGQVSLLAGADLTYFKVAAAGATLSGAGHLTLSDSAKNQIRGDDAAPGGTLTNAGNLISGAGQIGGASLVLVNQSGAIDASGVNALYIETTGPITNTGTLEATNAGKLAVTGGLTLAFDNVANVGGVIEAVGANTHVDLTSTTIIGGVLKTATGGIINVQGGADTLSGVAGAVTLDGNLAVADGGALTVSGSINPNKLFAGKISLDGAGAATQLIIAAAGVKITGGQVAMSDNTHNLIDTNNAGAVLTNSSSITGAGTIGSGGLVLVNSAGGVIDATSATNALVLNTGASTISNAGLIEATGAGGLVVDSTIRNSVTGKIAISGGGTMSVNNAAISGGTISVGTGSSFNLANVNLSGITLITTGTGVIATNGGTLGVNVKIAGGIDIATGTGLHVSGVLNNAGVISMIDNVETEYGTQIRLFASTKFEGGGTIVMGGTVSGQNVIGGNAAKFILTNVDNTITGAGNLGPGGLILHNQAAGVIDGAATSGTMVLNTGTYAVINAGLIESTGPGGIQIDSAITNTGTVLATSGGAVTLTNNATVTGGTVVTSGTGVIDIAGAASFASLATSASVYIGDGDTLSIGKTVVNTGTLSLAQQGHGGGVDISGTLSLAGSGRVVMGGIGQNNNSIFGAGAGSLLSNVSETISGGGNLGGGSLNIINGAGGVIDGDSTAFGIILNTQGSGSIVNHGLIEATGGGGITLTGATTLVNTGGTITVATGSSATLTGYSNLVGGVINGGGTVTVGQVVWTSVSNADTHVIVGDGDRLDLAGSLVNSGTIDLAQGGHGGGVAIYGAVSLTGKGAISMGGTGQNNNAIFGGNAGAVLTNVSNTISGGGNIGGGALTFINGAGGVVDGNSSAFGIVFNTHGTGSIVNQGLIESASGGAITLTGGTTLVNTGGTITAGAGTVLNLNGAAVIIGGVINGSGIVHAYSVSWSSVTNTNANVQVGDGNQLFLGGTVNNGGTISLAQGGHGGGVFIGGTVSLTGAGVISMGGPGQNNNAIVANGAGAVLDNVSNTISGGGNIGGGSLAIINGAAGVIDANSGAFPINLGGATLTNAGVVEAKSNGTLNVNVTTTNSGIMEALTGGTVNINGPVTNTGTIETVGGHVVIASGLSGAGKLVVNGGVMEAAVAGVAMATTFAVGGGTLQLDASQSFTGPIRGFSKTGATIFDLRDVGFSSAGEAVFVENGAGTSGTLTVTNGGQVAKLTLIGNYTGVTFTASDDTHGGVQVVASTPPGPAASLVAAMAAMAAPGVGAASSVFAGASHPSLAFLTTRG